MRLLRRTVTAALAACAFLSGPTGAEPLTADRAVQIALQRSTQAITAEATVLTRRGQLYSAYSGLMPRIGADLSRSGSWTRNNIGTSPFLGTTRVSTTYSQDLYSTTPELSGSWSPINLSTLSGLSAARGGLKAAQLQQKSARNDIALSVRRQFYTVVQAIQLAGVNAQALQLSRDSERRVRALFEVGSVSKSDVLKAEVQTAQSELDSLTAYQDVTAQRIALAEAIGVRDRDLGDLDTVLTYEPKDFDSATLLGEAEGSRPDLQAAETALKAARASLRAAKFLRIPSLTMSGAADFSSRNSSRSEQPLFDRTTFTEIPGTRSTTSSSSKTDRILSGRLALSWNIFDGFATEGEIAQARAGLLTAQESRDALRRNLEGEVQQALITYREAIERSRVARRAVDSAQENLKLTREKYNVGSSTILDLIDAQVQLQRAQSTEVSSLAGIRVAEAAIERVRGRGAD
jgi:outer membrane protein TolC